MTNPSSVLRDPEQLRAWGYKIVDRFVDAFVDESVDPVLPQVTAEELSKRFGASLPRAGASVDVVLGDMLELMDGTTRKNGHPGFLAYVCSSADPLGVLADFWISALNQNVTAWRSAPGATSLELQVVRWLSELVGFDGEHGMLTSGGSMANSTALAAALQAAAKRQGKALEDLLPMIRVYLSTEAHLSLRKAFALYGVRSENIQVMPVDGERRLDVEALRLQIAADAEDGFIPACVCASAGTVNTGAIDPLEEIAELCGSLGLWFHIDGAYGAPAAATAEYASLRDAFSRADSLSIDPHKWLFCPMGVGCILIRDRAITEATFRFDSAYTTDADEPGLDRFAFFEHGLEMSRRARAVKVWTVLRAFGADGVGAEVSRNIEMRRELDRRVEREDRLEGLGSGLSVACFRYRTQVDGGEDAVNRSIMDRLNQGGSFYLSPTTLNGQFCLRICIVNFRTTSEHLECLLDEVLRLGDDLEKRNL